LGCDPNPQKSPHILDASSRAKRSLPTGQVVVKWSHSTMTALGNRKQGLGNREEEEGLTLDELLKLVAEAGRPGGRPGLGEQLFDLTQAMATDPQFPPELRALGRALNRILSGERQSDLSGLPPALADRLRRLAAGEEG
jgi:hypothetical protein